MIGSKQRTPIYLSASQAESHCRAGGGIFQFASTESGLNPDVVLVGMGPELTFEVICAAALLRKRVPELRVRVVNVTDLMILGAQDNHHPHALSHADFESLFSDTAAIHFNYHGYAQELKGLLFGRPAMDRITIASYIEEGSTTTPFNMMLVNRVSRFHVAIQAVKGAATRNEKLRLRLHELVKEFEGAVTEATEYILENGKDMDRWYDMPTFEGEDEGARLGEA